tara:strand:- start:16861 stop:17217 length:357 start_codon:yes stop_codon:yes gene_type:complete
MAAKLSAGFPNPEMWGYDGVISHCLTCPLWGRLSRRTSGKRCDGHNRQDERLRDHSRSLSNACKCRRSSLFPLPVDWTKAVEAAATSARRSDVPRLLARRDEYPAACEETSFLLGERT